MPQFGKSSAERLATCHPDLQRLFNEVVKNYDCSILQGTRSKEEQDEFFFGTPQRSKVQYPNSKHNSNPSRAADVSPWPIDWKNTNRFYHFAGYVIGVADSMGITLRWGGDWDSDKDFSDNHFNDLPHFELVD